MKAKTPKATIPAKRTTSRARASSTQVILVPEPGQEGVTLKKPRARRSAPSKAKPPKPVLAATPEKPLPVAAAGPVRFFLGREGVAFGPYTESQLRESVQLGIFEKNDLALPENGTEWTEVARLLPPLPGPLISPPEAALTLPPPREPASLEPTELSLPARMPERPKPARSTGGPLSPQQLRELESICAAPSLATFLGELTRGRLAVAAVPVVVVVCALLTTAAVLKRQLPAARVENRPAPAAKAAAQQAPRSKPERLPTSFAVGKSLAKTDVPPGVTAGSSR